MTAKKISIFVFLMTLIALDTFAQGAPPATPIDGGLSFLLAAGGAYGVKRLLSKNSTRDS